MLANLSGRCASELGVRFQTPDFYGGLLVSVRHVARLLTCIATAGSSGQGGVLKTPPERGLV